MGNEYDYASGGHGASGNDEIFAENQGDKPWYEKSCQFFLLYSALSINESIKSYVSLQMCLFLGGEHSFLYLNQHYLESGMACLQQPWSTFLVLLCFSDLDG